MRFLVAAVLWILIAGCAVVYKPAPFWGAGGYSSKDINANTVSVNFLTGRTVDKNKAQTYALYRCAEITLEKEFDWFRIKEGSASSQSGPYSSYASATYVIEMFKGSPPPTQQHIHKEQTHVARTLMAQLESKIVKEEGAAPKTVAPASSALESSPPRKQEAVSGGPDRSAAANGPVRAKIAVDDVDAVPLLNERGKQGYRLWLKARLPRAFAVAEDGRWSSTSGRNPRNKEDPKDPVERALVQCQRRTPTKCKLYAVDDRVVWSAD